MNNLEVSRSKDRLDDLFLKIAKIDDVELKSHWARYLCVLVSGFLEVSFVELLEEFSRRQSSPHVSNYVSNSLSQFQNAKMGKMLSVVGQFSADWRTEIEEATKGKIADAVERCRKST